MATAELRRLQMLIGGNWAQARAPATGLAGPGGGPGGGHGGGPGGATRPRD